MVVSYGLFSHLYALMRVMPLVHGDVLEMGVGIGSTPFLHWACYGKHRLVSYETYDKYYKMLGGHRTETHEMHLIDDWDKVEIERDWGLAFVDHAPSERRHVDIARLANWAKYVVVHDTNPRDEKKYHYSKIYHLFKSRRDYQVAKTWVSVLSNFHDLSELPE